MNELITTLIPSPSDSLHHPVKVSSSDPSTATDLIYPTRSRSDSSATASTVPLSPARSESSMSSTFSGGSNCSSLASIECLFVSPQPQSPTSIATMDIHILQIGNDHAEVQTSVVSSSLMQTIAEEEADHENCNKIVFRSASEDDDNSGGNEIVITRQPPRRQKQQSMAPQRRGGLKIVDEEDLFFSLSFDDDCDEASTNEEELLGLQLLELEDGCGDSKKVIIPDLSSRDNSTGRYYADV